MQIAELKSRLSAHLATIGRTLFDCPEPRGNHDPLMHAYMVDTECAAYFKKQRDKSLNELLLAVDVESVDKIVAFASSDMAKQEASLLQDDRYMLMLNVKTPGTVLNVTALRSALLKGGRYTQKEIDVLFDEATSLRKPAKSFSVVPR